MILLQQRWADVPDMQCCSFIMRDQIPLAEINDWLGCSAIKRHRPEAHRLSDASR